MSWESLILIVFAYLLGSIPWGLIWPRFFLGLDVRTVGSGNVGAFNVYRVAGLKLGLLTLFGDLLKGALPVLIAVSLNESAWHGVFLPPLVALAAFLGHLYPVFLGFKGGKGVATAAGGFAVLSPMAFFVALLVYVLVICAFGYSSVASLAAAIILPVVVWFSSSHSISVTGCALIMTVFVFLRHRENIKRLMKGEENSPLRAS